MNRQQYLLTKLAEECSEVAQRALKAQQFGLYEKQKGQLLDNSERLQQELDDLLAIVAMLNKEFDFCFSPDEEVIKKKILKVNRYAEYSSELGLLYERD